MDISILVLFLQVKFKDYATEKEIRAILIDINGSIVAGPSANAIYRVKLGDDDIDIIQERIGLLYKKLDVIEFVSAE